MWIIYSVITAALESVKDIQSKHASSKVNEKVSALSYQLFALLVLIPITLYTGIPAIESIFYPVVLIGSILNSMWTVLYMRALKSENISDIIPLLAFNPVLTALLAIFFEGRFPDMRGWIGIVLVTAGLYVQKLTRHTLQHDVFKPFKTIATNPASKAMLGVALIWSVGSYTTKIASVASSPYYSSLINTILSAFFIWISMKSNQKKQLLQISPHLSSLVPLGIVNGLSKITLRFALQLGYTPFVMPIKRTNIIISSLYAKIILKEPFSKAKTVGLTLMFFGIILIIL